MKHFPTGIGWCGIWNTWMFECRNLYCHDLRSSCSWQSLKVHLDDRRFITRRNFLIEQEPSAKIIYIDAAHAKHRFNRKPNTKIISHIILNTSQSQEFNIPDVLVKKPSRNNKRAK